MGVHERRLWVVAIIFTLVTGMTIGVSLSETYGPACRGAM